MMRGMYSAISGLKTHQIALDVTANDLANVNTIGYKSSRTTFKDALTQIQRGGAAATPGSAGSNAAQVGLGSKLGSIDNVMVNGASKTTGDPLDVAIQGEGWIRVGVGPRPRATRWPASHRRRPTSTTRAPATSRATTRAT